MVELVWLLWIYDMMIPWDNGAINASTYTILKLLHIHPYIDLLA